MTKRIALALLAALTLSACSMQEFNEGMAAFKRGYDQADQEARSVQCHYQNGGTSSDMVCTFGSEYFR
jgi:hypothetical protein